MLSMVSIPVMLKYLKKEEYGVWLLILSIVNWVYTFDIGIGNGLKNKIAEFSTKKDNKSIREVILLSYSLIFIISVFLFIIGILSFRIIDINKFLNINFMSRENLNLLLIVTLGFVCLNFVLALCNNIFIGQQKTYLAATNTLVSQIFNIFGILGLFLLKKKSIFYLSIIYGLSITVAHIILTFAYFIKHKEIFPKISEFSFRYRKSLFGVSMKIFVTQIAGLIIFSTDNFIISYFLGTGKVAEYNIVNRFFAIFTLILSLVSGPLWSQATKQYYEKNYKWFKSILRRINILLVFIFLGNIFGVIIGKKFVYIWTAHKIIPANFLIISASLASFLTGVSNMYSSILFGINEINKMMYLSIFQAVLNIVLSYSFIKYLNLGTSGVILATAFCMLTNIFVLPQLLRKKIEEIKEI